MDLTFEVHSTVILYLENLEKALEGSSRGTKLKKEDIELGYVKVVLRNDFIVTSVQFRKQSNRGLQRRLPT